MLVSVVDRDGPHGRFEDVGAGEAVFRVDARRLRPRRGAGRLRRRHDARACAPPSATPPSPPADRTCSHGAALLEVVAGTGRLAGARGWVTSNYLLSDTGDLTDTHLGLLFVERP